MNGWRNITTTILEVNRLLRGVTNLECIILPPAIFESNWSVYNSSRIWKKSPCVFADFVGNFWIEIFPLFLSTNLCGRQKMCCVNSLSFYLAIDWGEAWICATHQVSYKPRSTGRGVLSYCFWSSTSLFLLECWYRGSQALIALIESDSEN